MLSRKTPFFLFFLFLLCCSFEVSGQNNKVKPHQLIYQIHPSTKEYVGLLYEVKDSSIVLTRDNKYSKNLLYQIRHESVRLEKKELIEVPFAKIKKLKVRKKGAIRNAILISAVAGALTGAIVSRLVHGEVTNEQGDKEKRLQLGISITASTIITGTALASIGIRVPVGHEKGLYLEDREKLNQVAILR